jgi:hypothetical protein
MNELHRAAAENVGIVPIAACALVAGVVVAALMVRRSARRHRSVAEELIDGSLASDIAGRTGLDPDLVTRALTGALVDDLIRQRIDGCIVAVHLVSERVVGHPGRVRLERRARFRDGESRAVTWEMDWDELPSSLRAEYLRGASTPITGDWQVPWRAAPGTLA